VLPAERLQGDCAVQVGGLIACTFNFFAEACIAGAFARDLNSPAAAPLCSPRLACIRGDAPLNVNISGHMLTFCVSSTGGAIDEGLR